MLTFHFAGPQAHSPARNNAKEALPLEPFLTLP